jgi:23S rRNA (cytidine2498-2'-O)-methyltransferase
MTTIRWAFLTRAGSETDLLEEVGEASSPEVLAEGVVGVRARPRGPDGGFRNLAFARQALSVVGVSALEADEVAERLAAALRTPTRADRDKVASGAGGTPSWSLQIVAPDSRDPHDPRRAAAQRLEELLPDLLASRLPASVRAQRVDEAAEAAELLQVWVLHSDGALLGRTSVSRALSSVPGGKSRLKRPVDALSRAGLKLEEAIEWIGVGPAKGELCADLGAAPGGWTQVALRRGAAVIAVDPARVKIEADPRKFTHVQESAFQFAPPETLDWLLCDMAWRPLEVAKLLAKWARRGWAQQFVANFKLPMKKKAEMVGTVLGVLQEAGWEGLRVRQLYHDRDEVTVYGWLRAGLVHRGAQAPFKLRSQTNKPSPLVQAAGRAAGAKTKGRTATAKPSAARPSKGTPKPKSGSGKGPGARKAPASPRGGRVRAKPAPRSKT